MSTSPPSILCTNPNCDRPANPLGLSVCEVCQTPLVYRYVWAVGEAALAMPPGQAVGDRYYVVAPQIWLDLRPGELPLVPEVFPDQVLPYLALYPQRLHVPEAYGFCPLEPTRPDSPLVLLLENVPIDEQGQLAPSLVDQWAEASSVRQLYWLWQILQLWPLLEKHQATLSLLSPENLRVEGWRVRLRELYFDAIAPEVEQLRPSLQDLGYCWANWSETADSGIQKPLQELCQQLQQPGAQYEAIALQLNRLLVTQAARFPLKLDVFGATDTGPQHDHNEDSCYPVAADLTATVIDPLVPHLAIVCDGIGGHEGGEVASQLAVRSLRLQVQALLTEVAEQPELATPDLIAEQLSASIRVANNLIAAQNDGQGREARRRMGTTLVMALHLPQTLGQTDSETTTHELYVAHVGDSRAYWITPTRCQCLTVDDDVATREVRMERGLYREALQRPDAGALTQALGTRDAELLRPTVQRFILEEDGIVLLCSDGLSDNGWVEKSWQAYAEPVLQRKQTLQDAVEHLIAIANQENGYDNTSVVMMRCLVSPVRPILFDPQALGVSEARSQSRTDWSEASRALLYGESEVVEEIPVEEPVTAVRKSRSRPRGLVMVMVGLLLLVLGGGAGLVAMWQFAPTQFEQLRPDLPRPLDRLLPPSPADETLPPAP